MLDRAGHPMQNPETQRHVEALAKLVYVKRVHPSILKRLQALPAGRAVGGMPRFSGARSSSTAASAA
jgi:hypothetical protein